ncbi:hypothetical protein CROQUDRAFT_21073, partial [Cronartium quercuum f. sp. fusiforme G11]
PHIIAPSEIITDPNLTFNRTSDIAIAQLNCFNKQLVMESILTESTYTILLLQEPWVNLYTLKIPSYPAWHELMPYDYQAQTYQDKICTCIYISKRIPSWQIALLPSKSPLLTAVELTFPQGKFSQIQLLSVYNPPRH